MPVSFSGEQAFDIKAKDGSPGKGIRFNVHIITEAGEEIHETCGATVTFGRLNGPSASFFSKGGGRRWVETAKFKGSLRRTIVSQIWALKWPSLWPGVAFPPKDWEG